MEDPIRILHVVTYMGRGGLETMLMNYYRSIDRTKVQFDFLTHRAERHEYDDEIESLGGRIFRISRLNPWSVSYRRELDEFFRSHPEYRIVHCHLDCMSAIPLRVAQKAGVPVRIAHAHSNGQDRNFKYLLKQYYKRKISGVATELFACSQSAGRWTFQRDSFTVLPNAIDVSQYCYDRIKRERMRSAFGLTHELVIGHVGRFSAVKNHEFILQLLRKLVDMEVDVKFLSVGGGSLLEEIKRKAHDMGLDPRVIFAGVRSDVADCMQAMDVFVMPSLYEGLGIAVLEAQSSGLPCLISDKVPIECKKTDLVRQISLSQDASVWAKAVVEASKTERKNTYQEIADSGFDIEENARKLQEFYLGLI